MVVKPRPTSDSSNAQGANDTTEREDKGFSLLDSVPHETFEHNLIVVGNGSKYHESGCRHVKNRTNLDLKMVCSCVELYGEGVSLYLGEDDALHGDSECSRLVYSERKKGRSFHRRVKILYGCKSCSRMS